MVIVEDPGGKSCWSPTSEAWWPCRASTGQQETEIFIHGNTSKELNLSPHQATWSKSLIQEKE